MRDIGNIWELELKGADLKEWSTASPQGPSPHVKLRLLGHLHSPLFTLFTPFGVSTFPRRASKPALSQGHADNGVEGLKPGQALRCEAPVVRSCVRWDSCQFYAFYAFYAYAM